MDNSTASSEGISSPVNRRGMVHLPFLQGRPHSSPSRSIPNRYCTDLTKSFCCEQGATVPHPLPFLLRSRSSLRTRITVNLMDRIDPIFKSWSNFDVQGSDVCLQLSHGGCSNNG